MLDPQRECWSNCIAVHASSVKAGTVRTESQTERNAEERRRGNSQKLDYDDLLPEEECSFKLKSGNLSVTHSR